MIEIKCPHYHLVPKGFRENVRWRKEILRDAANDPSFAAAMLKVVREDVLFYINTFCFTYDPRDQVDPHKPFITYEDFQDEAITGICHALRAGYDVTIPKSRTMGASWIGLTVFEWFWRCFDGLSFLLISRNENYVDSAGNPKSLFWKIDYLHERQPRWLLPTNRWLGWKDPNRRLLHLGNADNGSVIDGESTTGDAGRGDRRTGMFVDEHAAFELNDGFRVLKASRDTTRCRIFNSTPQGANNAFYEVVHKSAARQIRLHWSKHPRYNRGLYTIENGQVKLLDDFRGVVRARRKGWKESKDFIFPEDYPFVMDVEGKLRSPWYDNECARCVTEMEIAQELDVDFLGSEYQFFDPQFINALVKEYCQPPILSGNIEYDGHLEPTGIRLGPKGHLKLWLSFAGNGEFLTDRSVLNFRHFGLGADVSMGTGASNSVASIVDLVTGEKVAVWRDSNTDPKAFADVCMALAKFFNHAKMIWDGSGPTGKTFTCRVIEAGYSNIYYRRSEGRIRERISDQPGYFLNPADRAVVLREYRSSLEERKFINRSEQGMKEALQFIVLPGGKVEHSAAANSQDPSGAREAHGDEVIADALVSRLLKLDPKELEQNKQEVPWMSPAWRFEQAALAAREAEEADW